MTLCNEHDTKTCCHDPLKFYASSSVSFKIAPLTLDLPKEILVIKLDSTQLINIPETDSNLRYAGTTRLVPFLAFVSEAASLSTIPAQMLRGKCQFQILEYESVNSSKAGSLKLHC